MRVVMLEDGDALHDRRLQRAPARHDRASSTATPRRRRPSATCRSSCRSGAVSAARRRSTPAPASARPRRCSRCGASASASSELTADELDPYFRRVERILNVVQVPPEIAGQQRAGRQARRRRARLVGRLHLPQRARLRRLRRLHVRLPDVGQAVDQPELRAARVGRRRHDLHRHARARRSRRRTAARPRVIRDDQRRRHASASSATPSIVACGAIHTPLFLEQAAASAPSSGELGRNLAIHPATGVRAIFDEEIDMARGVPQSYYVDEFADDRLMFEGAAGPPDYLAMTMPFSRERHRDLMLRYRHFSQFGVMVSDLSRGHRARAVRPPGDPLRPERATTRRRSSAASSCCASCTSPPARAASCRRSTASGCSTTATCRRCSDTTSGRTT